MRYLALVFLMAAACCAEDLCPYLNAATAAGVLGGEVSLHINANFCVFARGSSQLRIEVQMVSLPYEPRCEPHPTALRGIGNAAFGCSTEDKQGNLSEQIAARVRDRAFFIRLTSNNIARAALSEKVRSVAEQVAGSLY